MTKQDKIIFLRKAKIASLKRGIPYYVIQSPIGIRVDSVILPNDINLLAEYNNGIRIA